MNFLMNLFWMIHDSLVLLMSFLILIHVMEPDFLTINFGIEKSCDEVSSIFLMESTLTSPYYDTAT